MSKKKQYFQEKRLVNKNKKGSFDILTSLSSKVLVSRWLSVRLMPMLYQSNQLKKIYLADEASFKQEK